jgi:GT2 family glycosyltransferase
LEVSVIVLTTDPTKPMVQSVLKAIMETTPKPFELVVDHVSSSEFGFSSGINRMVRGARGENLILVNDDCKPSPGWVEKMVTTASEPGVGIVGGLLDGASDEFVTFGLVLIRREVFRRIGGLNERYRLGHEDTDFCLRAVEAGFKVKCVDVGATHLRQTSSRTLRATSLHVRSTVTYGIDRGYSPFKVVFDALWIFSYNFRYAARTFPLAAILRGLKHRL